MTLNVPQLNLEGLLLNILRRLEALEAGAGAPGATPGFFSFGPSDKNTNDHLQGYDPVGDGLLASGGVMIETFQDAPNIWFRRRNNHPSSTGFSNNDQLGRIGGVAMAPTLDTGYLMNNGNDGEECYIVFRLLLQSDGDTLVGRTSAVNIAVVNSMDANPLTPPFECFEVNGVNGGEWVFHGFNSDGSPCNKIIAQRDF